VNNFCGPFHSTKHLPLSYLFLWDQIRCTKKKKSTFTSVSSSHKHVCYCITRPVSYSLLRTCNTKNIRIFTSVSPYVGVFPQTPLNFTFELKSTSPKLKFYFLIVYCTLPLYTTALPNYMQPSHLLLT